MKNEKIVRDLMDLLREDNFLLWEVCAFLKDNSRLNSVEIIFLLKTLISRKIIRLVMNENWNIEYNKEINIEDINQNSHIGSSIAVELVV